MAAEGLAYLQYPEEAALSQEGLLLAVVVAALSQEVELPQVMVVAALSQVGELPQVAEAVAVLSQELGPPLVLLLQGLELREFAAQQPVLRELLFPFGQFLAQRYRSLALVQAIQHRPLAK